MQKTIEERLKLLEDKIENNVVIPIELIDDAILPFYANPTDAGCDLYAKENVIIKPETTKIIKTGIKTAIPEGYELQVRPRSGLSAKTSLRVANSPGTIDAGYRDEIGVIITNTNTFKNNGTTTYYFDTIDNKNNDMSEESIPLGTYLIKKGDRIAQLVLNKIYKAKFEIVKSVEKIGENRGGGFGHTGTK